MSRMIQIRNVPDEVHKRLKAKAALEGVTLSEFLLREARLLAEQPTSQEMRARLAERARVRLPEPAARSVRRERDRR